MYMTKHELKQFNEWKDAVQTKEVSTAEIEFDVYESFSSIERVRVLRSKGYTINNWVDYANAEVSERN